MTVQKITEAVVAAALVMWCLVLLLLGLGALH